MTDDDFTDKGFIEKDGLLYYNDLLYIPQKLRLSILTSRHDSITAGHFGTRKTLDLIARDYWWPHMHVEIKHYVETCDTCQRTKSSRKKYSGTLQPLPTPSERWEVVTMDFITDLPVCQGYDSICTIVDKFTKMAHFWPCQKSISSNDTALLYIDKVWRLHGFPKRIISDRGAQFMSDFWKIFLGKLGAERVMSTAYHPETDGQSERVNGVINQYLRVYTSYLQDDWVELLATAEFSYNNSWQASIKTTPFIANFGRNPSFDAGEAKAFTDVPHELADRLIQVRDFITNNLEKAREDQKRFADRHRDEAPVYEEGDKVMLSTKNITSLRPKVKWSNKYMGPYKVIGKSGNNAFMLDLPMSLNIHPVFHTSLLLPYCENTMPDRKQPPPPAVVIDNEVEWEIDSILDSRIHRGNKQYLVSWKGYKSVAEEWLHEDAMEHCEQLIAEFMKEHPQPRFQKRRKARR